MDDDRTICSQEDHQDEADEALSLADFPLDHNSTNNESSTEPPDFFEFLNDVDLINISDDIIVRGKLMPFKGQPDPTRQKEETKLPSPFPLRSRSDSSSVQKGTEMKLMRSSQSLDGTSYVRGNFGKQDFMSENKRGTTRPRWYVYMMMFGMAKFPTEMELRDIKTRQLRRAPSTVAGGEKFPASHRHRSGTWKLLKALSCKDHASVAVATSSFACLPQSEGLVSNH